MDILQSTSLFSKEECDIILSYSTSFKPSGIRLNGSDVITEYRISENCYINNPDLNALLLSKLSSLNIISIPRVEILKYEIGSKFRLHRDRDEQKKEFLHRYKTLIIQLSDQQEYTGGELVIEGTEATKKIGSVIVFNSKLLHEVKELTSGLRYSLCLFLVKENFKETLL